MSIQLVKGANASLSEASPLLRAIEIQLSWSADVDAEVAVALLGVDHRLPGDGHVIPASQLGGDGHPLSRGGDILEVDLTSVPSDLTAMAFLVSAPDLAGPERTSLAQLHPAQVRISDAVTAVELARYDLEPHSAAETSVVFAEIYWRSGQWKVRAVGQGSDGGLTAVLRSYGGTDLPTSAPSATSLNTAFLRRRAAAPAASSGRPLGSASGDAGHGPAATVSLEKEPLRKPPQRNPHQPAQQPRGEEPTTDVMAPPAAATTVGAQPVDRPAGWSAPELLAAPAALSARTILNDRRPSIRVAPQQVGGGELALTLTWVRPAGGQPRGASQPPGRAQPTSTDLHLGALWQLSSGLSGALQSLGGHRRGPVRGETILRLGPRSETEGETVTIDLARLADLHRVVLFVYAYSGRPQWQLLRPAITATWANGAKVEARIDDAPPVATICAAVSLHRVGQTLVLRREAEFLRGQQSAVATAYGFDLGWSRGQVMPGR